MKHFCCDARISERLIEHGTSKLTENLLVFLIPKPIVERFLAPYILIFVKNYHMGLNNPRTPSEMGESKLDKKWWGLETRLRLKKKSNSLLQKTVWKSIQGK